ncbi:MAG TPA: DUF1493 family protein [Calditrichaeota bacterium]|nr:DUF1493 family protein [Calditrichota bacterium]
MIFKSFISILITLFAIQIVSSCKKENNRLLDKVNFVNITAELMIIEKLNINAAKKTLLANNVFKKYKVNPENYWYTKDHYQNDPAFWADFYKQVQIRIKYLIKKNKNAKKFSL